MMRRTIGTSLVIGLFSAVVALAVPGFGSEPSFEDVPENHLFAEEIAWLAIEGITRGCNPPQNDQFCPDDPVTRGQMAAFLVRALRLPAGTGTFTDTTGHVFEGDIARLAAADITRGCNPPQNDQFCPDDPVTRGQMAAFLNRA
ncbi:MAG TPA: S-layer homology domain-containing protein, partial [Acidimicrobiia bacterium]|nr:S-layer homology domain-containing protein [Acidimicrobiia bacterium]